MARDVTAVVLAGGLGTRLRSEVADRPKVLAEVAGRPFLDHVFKQIQSFAIKEVVLCVGYMAEQVEALYGEFFGDLHISFSVERALLGTGGAVRFAVDQVRTENLLVLNGDSYCAFDFEAFATFHESSKSKASMLLTHTNHCGRYGSVRLNDQNRIDSFIEKGNYDGPGLVNAGVYMVNRQLARTLPAGRVLSLERDVFPNWIPDGLYGFVTETQLFIDIGTPQSFHQAQALFDRSAE